MAKKRKEFGRVYYFGVVRKPDSPKKVIERKVAAKKAAVKGNLKAKLKAKLTGTRVRSAREDIRNSGSRFM